MKAPNESVPVLELEAAVMNAFRSSRVATAVESLSA